MLLVSTPCTAKRNSNIHLGVLQVPAINLSLWLFNFPFALTPDRGLTFLKVKCSLDSGSIFVEGPFLFLGISLALGRSLVFVANHNFWLQLTSTAFNLPADVKASLGCTRLFRATAKLGTADDWVARGNVRKGTEMRLINGSIRKSHPNNKKQRQGCYQLAL